MHRFLFSSWWSTLTMGQQIFWSIATVFSLLSLILFILDLFEEETGRELSISKKRKLLDARIILIFFTSFGWASVLISIFLLDLWLAASLGALLALTVTIVQGFYFGFPWRESRDVRKILQSTGEVLQFIPPNHNGTGKVQLEVRKHPVELEALSAGRELPVGASVRVVDIVDEKVVVELLDQKPPNL